MNGEKKTGRRFKDFSHLFISSQNESPAKKNNSKLASILYDVKIAKPIMCITNISGPEQRVLFMEKIAIELVSKGKKVFLIDADFRFPRIDFTPGKAKFFSLINLLKRNSYEYERRLDRLKLITIDVDIPDFKMLNMKKRILLKRYFMQFEEDADVVLISVPYPLHNFIVEKLLKSSNWFITLIDDYKDDIDEFPYLLNKVSDIKNDISFGVVMTGAGTKQISDNIFNHLNEHAKKYLDRDLHNFGFVNSGMLIEGKNNGKEHREESEEIYTISRFSKQILDLIDLVYKQNYPHSFAFPLTTGLIG